MAFWNVQFCYDTHSYINLCKRCIRVRVLPQRYLVSQEGRLSGYWLWHKIDSPIKTRGVKPSASKTIDLCGSCSSVLTWLFSGYVVFVLAWPKYLLLHNSTCMCYKHKQPHGHLQHRCHARDPQNGWLLMAVPMSTCAHLRVSISYTRQENQDK